MAFIIPLLAICAGCATQALVQRSEITTFTDIVAHPSMYAGKHVKTVGWFVYRFEDCSLWSDAKAVDIAHLDNAIWVNGPKVTCLSKDVSLHPRSGMAIVEGEIHVGHVGHLGLFNMSILNATVTFDREK
ncbi:MAG: hypothetical protein ACYC9L_06275 [Sulfuricaulis sp.]